VILEQAYSKFRLPAALIIAVCGVVLVVHWPGLSAKALSFDDNQYLTENVLVQYPSLNSIVRFFTEVLKPSTVEGYYQPMTMLSLMFDYVLGGRENNLVPFHITSLALHIANTALIIVLLYLLFGQMWVAAGVGLLFGVHPLTVETIPWIGERKTLLAAFFSLWSLIFYVIYTRKNDKKFYFWSFATYLLALMSKPTSLPLPAVMLLMDYWPLNRLKTQDSGCKTNKLSIFRDTGYLVLDKLPFFMLGGVFAIITYISQSRAANAILPTEFGPGRIPLILCHNIIFYLYKMVWPVNLSSHYVFPEPLNLSQPMVLAGVIGTCILIPLLVISLRWTRAALTGWLIFFVAILPTMQIIGFSNVIASDKFAYLPSAGLLMILAAFLVWLCSIRFSTLCRIAAAIILVLVCAEAVGTRRYLVCWQDTIKLYENMLSLTPDAAPLHLNIGITFQLRKNLDEAISHYHRALELKPDDAPVYNSLGTAMEAKGDPNKAVRYYLQAIKLIPHYAEAYYNLGHLFQLQGKFDDAISYYQQTISLKPNFPDAHYNLAYLLASQGKLDEAIPQYRQTLRIKPYDSDAHNNLGIAMEAKGNFNEAISCYRNAVHFKRDNAEACYNLGHALQSRGRLDEAIGYYHQAIKIKPDYAKAHNNLGTVLQSQGKFDAALTHFREALKLRPGNANTYYNIGFTLALQGKSDEAVNNYNEALRIEPNDAEIHYNIGVVRKTQGKFNEAMVSFRKTLNIEPNSPPALSEMANILATSPDPNIRDTDKAIALAERAAELSKYKDAAVLETLAAGYAAKGQFDKAVTTAQTAMSLADADLNQELAEKLRRQLELYKQKKH
jgi:tetratricopeptide (TPR) repeat protein